jgi:pyridinium-3,5-biscarboxylic acid mononucleotide sulfurtransferase
VYNKHMNQEMVKSLDEKLMNLRCMLRDTGGVAIAFSGGVDSSFLAAVAFQELQERALAVTVISSTFPVHVKEAAINAARAIGIEHILIYSDELDLPGFSENTRDRCYICKQGLYSTVRNAAESRGIKHVADGNNFDDLNDYRPGMRAASEAVIIQPLLRAELHKEEIRELSRRMGLPTADRPASACLASRFPYGTYITQERIAAVDAVEQAVRALGIRQVRARYHGNVVRIEVETGDIPRLCGPAEREHVLLAARAAGFLYVALDLQGYRTGSLNEEKSPV